MSTPHNVKTIRHLLYSVMKIHENDFVAADGIASFTEMPTKLIIVTKSRQRFIVHVEEETTRTISAPTKPEAGDIEYGKEIK